MTELAKFFTEVWAWLLPVLSLLVSLIILGYVLRTAWEKWASQPFVEPLVKWLNNKPAYITWLKYTKTAQPFLIALCAVFLALTGNLDLTTIFGSVIQVDLVDEQTRQIASGLVWALSAFVVHDLAKAKNASNVSGGTSGLTPVPGLTPVGAVRYGIREVG